MSGHSKWSQIKRQKGATDARRGQLFTKLGNEISIAARAGGGDPAGNIRLRLAIQKAKDNNMPADNIERAIKRGAGGGEAVSMSEITYEAYGPGGIALLIDVLTNNRNRTVADIRNILTRAGGSLGETGSVGWLFDQRGVINVEAQGDPDEMALTAIEAGADDVKVEDGVIEVLTQPQDLEAVRHSMENGKLHVQSAEIAMVPKSTLALEEKEALQALKLLDKLEEMDDVQRVYTNADFPDEVLEKYQG